MKDCFGLTKGKRGYHTSTIEDQNIRFIAKLLACKLLRKCRPTEVPASIIRLTINCAEGYTYNWAAYLTREFLEDARDAQEKGRPFHYSWIILLIVLVLRREIPMAWGTTIDRPDSRNQSFPICNRNKMSNTKGSDLIPYSERLK